MAEYNEKKYNKAIKTLAKQLVIMATDDVEDITDQEDIDAIIGDYAAHVIEDIRDAITEGTS